MLKSLTFLLVLSVFPQTQAFFRLSCQNALTIERADPIVAPGKVAGHTHIVSGGSGFSPSATGADLRGSQCSSCLIEQDMSAYWSPSLYFQFANGSVASVNNLNGGSIYYKLFSNPADTTNITAFPDDFQMITGNSANRDPNNVPTYQTAFVCMMSNGSATQTANLPSWDCDAGLRTTIEAPSCWNGVDVAPPGGQSHMAYPTWDSGFCPTGFPVRVPSLRYEISYNTGDFSPYRNLAMNPQQPFVFSNGDPTGYGYHFDFFNGWTDLTVLQAAIDQCGPDQGILEDCPPLSLYSYDHACHRTPDINEVVTGILPSLPGNNPINWGPAATVPPAAATTPSFISNPSVYTGGAPPPIAIVLGNSPKVVLASGAWTYQNCYQQNGTAAMSHGVSAANKSVEACLSACDAQGYSFCAISSGGWQCAGGYSISASTQVVDYGQCSRTCVDAPGEYCGSWDVNTMDLYSKPATVSLVQSYNNWTFSACTTNWAQGTQILSKYLWSAALRTVQSCMDECDKNGFTVCGMSGGDSCYGGLAIQLPNTAVDTSLCDTTCTDDSSHFCGGNNKVVVYTRPPSTLIVQQAGNYTYTTCYQGTSSNNGPTMATTLWPNKKTVESCVGLCQAQGFLYCGVQYFGNMCFGSNTLDPASTVAAPGSCATYCNDAPLEWCGGYSAIGLYTLNSPSSSSMSLSPTTSLRSTATKGFTTGLALLLTTPLFTLASSSSSTRATVALFASSSGSSTTPLVSSSLTSTTAPLVVQPASTSVSSLVTTSNLKSMSSTTVKSSSTTTSTKASTTIVSTVKPASSSSTTTSKSSSTTTRTSSTTLKTTTTLSSTPKTTTTTSRSTTTAPLSTSSALCPAPITITSVQTVTFTVSTCPTTSASPSRLAR